MKRIIAMSALVVMTASLTACGGSSKQEDVRPQPQANQQPAASSTQVTVVNNVPSNNSGLGETVENLTLLATGIKLGQVMSNGETFNGRNWSGPAPAGYDVDPRTHELHERPEHEKARHDAEVKLDQIKAKSTDAAKKQKVKNPGDVQAVADQKADAAAAAAVAQKTTVQPAAKASVDTAKAVEQKVDPQAKKDAIKARIAAMKQQKQTSKFKEHAAKASGDKSGKNQTK